MIAPVALEKPRRLRLAEGARLAPLANWRQAIGGVFDVAAEPAEIGRFSGDVELHATTRIVLSRIAASAVRLARTPQTILRDRLDVFAIALVAPGGFAGLAAQNAIEAGAGDIVFLDLQQTVDLEISPRGGATTALILWVPRPRVLASIREENALHGLVLKGATPAGVTIGASLGAFAASAAEMSLAEMDALADGFIELIGRALTPTLANLSGSENSSPLSSFVAIRRFIDRNLTSPHLDADRLAKQFGLSRSTLYRLFEPVGGVAVYVRRHRLHRAYQQVVAAETSDARIGQIGYRLGFGNVSAFSRTFRTNFGMSPREARKAALGRERAPALTAEPPQEASLAGWLAALSRK